MEQYQVFLVEIVERDDSKLGYLTYNEAHEEIYVCARNLDEALEKARQYIEQTYGQENTKEIKSIKKSLTAWI